MGKMVPTSEVELVAPAGVKTVAVLSGTSYFDKKRAQRYPSDMDLMVLREIGVDRMVLPPYVDFMVMPFMKVVQMTSKAGGSEAKRAESKMPPITPQSDELDKETVVVPSVSSDDDKQGAEVDLMVLPEVGVDLMKMPPLVLIILPTAAVSRDAKSIITTTLELDLMILPEVAGRVDLMIMPAVTEADMSSKIGRSTGTETKVVTKSEEFERETVVLSDSFLDNDKQRAQRLVSEVDLMLLPEIVGLVDLMVLLPFVDLMVMPPIEGRLSSKAGGESVARSKVKTSPVPLQPKEFIAEKGVVSSVTSEDPVTTTKMEVDLMVMPYLEVQTAKAVAATRFVGTTLLAVAKFALRSMPSVNEKADLDTRRSIKSGG